MIALLCSTVTLDRVITSDRCVLANGGMQRCLLCALGVQPTNTYALLVYCHKFVQTMVSLNIILIGGMENINIILKHTLWLRREFDWFGKISTHCALTTLLPILLPQFILCAVYFKYLNFFTHHKVGFNIILKDTEHIISIGWPLIKPGIEQ